MHIILYTEHTTIWHTYNIVLPTHSYTYTSIHIIIANSSRDSVACFPTAHGAYKEVFLFGHNYVCRMKGVCLFDGTRSCANARNSLNHSHKNTRTCACALKTRRLCGQFSRGQDQVINNFHNHACARKRVLCSFFHASQRRNEEKVGHVWRAHAGECKTCTECFVMVFVGGDCKLMYAR